MPMLPEYYKLLKGSFVVLIHLLYFYILMDYNVKGVYFVTSYGLWDGILWKPGCFCPQLEDTEYV